MEATDLLVPNNFKRELVGEGEYVHAKSDCQSAASSEQWGIRCTLDPLEMVYEAENSLRLVAKVRAHFRGPDARPLPLAASKRRPRKPQQGRRHAGVDLLLELLPPGL
jgi:hypothetical protein